MILVADASFAAKLVIDEQDSDIAQEWWDDRAVWVAPAIIGPEVQSALQLRHRLEPDVFDEQQLQTATTSWSQALGHIAIHVVDRKLGEAARRIQASFPLRGADAVYVALAHELTERTNPALLATFDDQQRTAARQLGIPVTHG